MSQQPPFSTASGIPVADNQNSISAGPRGPLLLQDFHLIEKLQHFNRERIPERVVHAKGSGAYGTFTVTHDISRYTKAKLFAEVGKQTATFARFSTVGGERGSADTERDPARLRRAFLYGRGQLGPGWQQHAHVLHQGPDQVPRFRPHAEARSAKQLEIGRNDVRLLEPCAGKPAPGHHAVFGPRHAGRLRASGLCRQRRRQLPRALERAPLAHPSRRALQSTAMSLHQLPALQAIGGTKTEVKEEIEKRIGLSFDQFTRAVLLAQNEFPPSSRRKTMSAESCWKP